MSKVKFFKIKKLEMNFSEGLNMQISNRGTIGDHIAGNNDRDEVDRDEVDRDEVDSQATEDDPPPSPTSSDKFTRTRAQKRQSVLKGTAVPIKRRVYASSSRLVGGSSSTCQPDAAAMILAYFGKHLPTLEARKICMPDWRTSNTPPSMLQINQLYAMHGLTVFSRSDLICNPLGLFRQKEGVFHLIFSLAIPSGEKTEHAAVYNASESILKDNQNDVDPLRIEDSDRTSKKSARSVFKKFWPTVCAFEMTNVYEIRCEK